MALAVRQVATAFTTANAGSVTATFPSSTATLVGSLLVAVLSTGTTNGSVTLTPDQGGTDTWTALASTPLIADTLVGMYYAQNIQTGKASYTFARSTNGAIAVTLIEITGADTTAPLDVQVNTSGATSGVIATGTTAATAQANEIWVALFHGGWTNNGTHDVYSGLTAGYTLEGQATSTNGSPAINCASAIGYQIVSATGTPSAQITLGSSPAGGLGCLVTFKAAASGTAYTRSASSTQAPSVVASHLLSLLRSQAVVQTPATTALRVGVFSRLLTITAALTPAANRVGSFLRSQAIAVAPLPAVAHLLALLRSSAVTASPAPSGTRQAGMSRLGSALEVPSSGVSHLLSLLRAGGVTLIPATTAARAATMSRARAVVTTLTTTGTRLAAMARLGTLTEVVSTTASGVKNAGSQAWSRAAGITAAMVTGTSRVVGFSRLNQATVIPTMTSTRSGVFARLATVVAVLATTSSRRAVLSRLQAVTEAVSTTASGVINGGSQAWTRAAGITVTAVTTASRALAFPRLGQTTVTPATGSTRRVGFGRVTTAVTTPVIGVLRSVGFQRLSAITAVVAMTSGRVFGLVRQGGVVVASAPHTARAMVLTRLAPTQIVPVIVASGAQGFGGSVISIVTWAASRVTKTIRDLVTVYVRNQQRANHTLDTAGNFDAAFGTFSGDIVPAPTFPDPRPKTPLDAENLELDQWVTSRLQPGNYSLITAFSKQQRLTLNLRDTFANYDAAYAAFVQAQEPVRWHP